MLDDIYVWPDGTWCYSDEIEEYGFMSDDYTLITFDTQAYYDFMDQAFQ